MAKYRSLASTYNDSNWKDKLTSYDGKAITYDAIGNPTAYDGWTYTWEGGRQLKSMTKTGQNISYKYDDNGIRTQKTVNGVTTNYYTVDGRITAEETNDMWTYFHYDQAGELLFMELNNGSIYYYLKDALGNIIGLAAFYNNNYEVMVEYNYDAWGNLASCTGPMSSSLGVTNPFLYKGYYFDRETGYYYLQSRYYSPEWCRFINADDPNVLNITQGDVMGVNLFAYCNNNPVVNEDPSGRLRIRKDVIATAIDLLIYAIPALIAINKTLKALKAVGPAYKLLNGAKWIPTLITFTTKALTKLGLRIKLTAQIFAFMSTSSLILTNLSIGGLIAWGLGKIFKVEKGQAKQFIWFGKMTTVEYVRFW